MGHASLTPLACCQLIILPNGLTWTIFPGVKLFHNRWGLGVSMPFHVGSTAHDLKDTGLSPEEGTAQAFHSSAELKAKLHKDVNRTWKNGKLIASWMCARETQFHNPKPVLKIFFLLQPTNNNFPQFCLEFCFASCAYWASYTFCKCLTSWRTLV